MRDQPAVCFISIGAYTYFAPNTAFPPGGAERQLYLIGQELKTDFDVHFVVGDFGQPATECRDGVMLHRAYEPMPNAPVYRRPLQVVKLFLAMRSADANIYVFRGEHTRAIVTYALASLLGKHWVYNLALDSHAELGKEGLNSPKQQGMRWILDDADHIIAQTPHQQSQLDAVLNVDSTVVPNGYPSLSDVPSVDDREFFLYVGRIKREQKRPHLFLELARRLSEAEFVLIGPNSGDDRYYEHIAETAAELPNVTFLGEVTPETVHEYFQRAIALVNTSTEEGFPNTFLEAWRAETPVLSLDVDPGRFLDASSAGYAAGDFDRLVTLAEQLAASSECRKSIGRSARQYFEQHYHISVTADEYADALRSCLDRSDTEGDH